MPTELTKDDPKSSIKSLGKAFDIIEAISRLHGAELGELTAHLDMPRSTVHVYLKTLEHYGYVVEEEGTWRLGLRFLHQGGQARKRLKVYRAASQEVDRIAVATNECANLGVEQNGMRVLLYKSEPEQGVTDNTTTGEFQHMNLTGLGKALLAWKSREEVQAIIDTHGLPKATDKTITDPDELFEELARTVERGHAIEDGDHREAIATIAVPVLKGDSDDPIAALSVTGPRKRILPDGPDESILEELQYSADVVLLKYDHYL